MKRGFVLLGVVAGAAIVLHKIFARDSRSLSEHCSGMFEKKLEAMPESFPPKRMFDNLAAIREQTQQILDLLQERERKAPEAWEGPVRS